MKDYSQDVPCKDEDVVFKDEMGGRGTRSSRERRMMRIAAKIASIVFIFTACICAPLHATEVGVQTDVMPPGHRYVRIRTLDGSGWHLPDYNAQQVLAIIRDLKPNVLERYISEPVNTHWKIPVAEGYPPMSAIEFLNESMKAGAPGCYITPRLSLLDDNLDRVVADAQKLYDLPIDPPMRKLSLDNYERFVRTHDAETVQTTLRRIAEQGWEEIAVINCGGYFSAYKKASAAEFCISADTKWTPAYDVLDRFKQDQALNNYLLYIDSPKAMEQFLSLNSDQMVKILSKVIAPEQVSHGFTFVYPILQWPNVDSTKVTITTEKSPNGNETLYQLMKRLMQKYNPS